MWLNEDPGVVVTATEIEPGAHDGSAKPYRLFSSRSFARSRGSPRSGSAKLRVTRHAVNAHDSEDFAAFSRALRRSR